MLLFHCGGKATQRENEGYIGTQSNLVFTNVE